MRRRYACQDQLWSLLGKIDQFYQIFPEQFKHPQLGVKLDRHVLAAIWMAHGCARHGWSNCALTLRSPGDFRRAHHRGGLDIGFGRLDLDGGEDWSKALA